MLIDANVILRFLIGDNPEMLIHRVGRGLYAAVSFGGSDLCIERSLRSRTSRDQGYVEAFAGSSGH